LKPALLGLMIMLAAGLSLGHPLGNNTVNRAASIEVAREHVSIRYLLDLAEIPTLLAAQEADADGDGSASPSEWDAYARRRGDDIRTGIDLTAEGQPLALSLDETHWQRVPGAAGLDTLLLEARLSAPLKGYETARVDYRDRRQPEEVGWKEVVASVADGLRLVRCDVPDVSPSRMLSGYPPAAAGVPDVVAAHIEFEAPPPSVARRSIAPVRAASQPAPAPPPTYSPPEVRAVEANAPAMLTPENTAAARPAGQEPQAPAAGQFAAFFRLGMHHIATGWDHIAFLLGLLAAQRSLRRLAWVVTAFTLAHSLTLGLASGGLVRPPGDWVDPAIAFTIAYVGLANLVGWLRHGAAVAFTFGLIHGFGFAGALAESLQGTRIGGAGWLIDLAAFNLGIEAFQLILILMLLPLIHLGRRLDWSGMARQAVSVGVLGVGLGWLFAHA
jgi:hypothetical protein